MGKSAKAKTSKPRVSRPAAAPRAKKGAAAERCDPSELDELAQTTTRDWRKAISTRSGYIRTIEAMRVWAKAQLALEDGRRLEDGLQSLSDLSALLLYRYTTYKVDKQGRAKATAEAIRSAMADHCRTKFECQARCVCAEGAS
jgi:hypothetical protein